MKSAKELSLIELALNNDGKLPTYVWDSLTKQQLGYLKKWVVSNHWDYGVSLVSGWLTPKGIRVFRSICGESNICK